MARNPNDKPQIAAVVVLAVAAAAVTIKTVGGEPNRVETNLQPPKRHVEIDWVSQEAAAPGKVIHANEDGEEVARYVCGKTDAAVATLYIDISSPGPIPYVSLGKASGSDGRPHSAHVRQKGSVVFVIIDKDYIRPPNSVSVTVNAVLPPNVFDTGDLSIPIKLTQFAPARAGQTEKR